MGLSFDDSQMLEPLRRHFEPALPLRRALQRVDLMTFCSSSILAKVDRASMAHSLEVRVPFLDRRLIDWALSLPADSGDSAEGKLPQRRYLATRVPRSVLDHPKQGFSLRVLDDYDYNAALRRIRDSLWVREGHWSKEWTSLIRPGVPYREARIWIMQTLALWAEAWLR
jgi:asparagine synthase (glutamine-hydrolysing)